MKKHHGFLIALVLVLLLAAGAALASCGSDTPAKPMEDKAMTNMPMDGMETAYRKITAEEAKALMDEGNVTVVDVRRADEYQAGHIPGAIHIPNESISTEMPEALMDQNAVLLVYCRSGVRSKDASDKLVAMGYAHVNDMGGIMDWPYETVMGMEPGQYPMPSKKMTP